MSNNIAISFEHVSKMYQLGVVGTGTISNDLKRWWAMSVRGKEDPFLKIGQTNDRATKGTSDFVYALRDIDFKVEQGDVVGIIGKNGAGKSTLLKLLSRITAPTSGCIKANGRIASLLEVGTGFHQELTGRENIYLNGTIMGMKRHEIDAKLDEIVDFAGVERYIDTPVKRYSSGMQVRLGFAVAAFLEPEILVVDEVLAVGDAEFQRKAIGKMQDVANGQGRTVLFVSHNMASVKNLCKKGIVLENGEVRKNGSIDEAIDYYLSQSISIESKNVIDSISFHDSRIKIDKILVNNTEKSISTVYSNQLELDIEIQGFVSEPIKYDLMVVFRTTSGIALATLAKGHYQGVIKEITKGNFTIKEKIQLPKYIANGDCLIDVNIHHPNVCWLMKAPSCALVHFDGGLDEFGQTIPLSAYGIMGLESK